MPRTKAVDSPRTKRLHSRSHVNLYDKKQMDNKCGFFVKSMPARLNNTQYWEIYFGTTRKPKQLVKLEEYRPQSLERQQVRGSCARPILSRWLSPSVSVIRQATDSWCLHPELAGRCGTEHKTKRHTNMR